MRTLRYFLAHVMMWSGMPFIFLGWVFDKGAELIASKEHWWRDDGQV